MITRKSKQIDAGTQFTVGNSNDSLGAGLDWVKTVKRYVEKERFHSAR